MDDRESSIVYRRSSIKKGFNFVAKIYYDKDADLSCWRGKDRRDRFGSQGMPMR